MKWFKLGELLGDSTPEWELWWTIGEDAEFLPFHAGEAIYKYPIGKFMRCGPGSATNPFELIQSLLTDGRAVYRAIMRVQDARVGQVIAYLNLPFNEGERDEMARLEVQLKSGRGYPVGKNSKKQDPRSHSPEAGAASSRKEMPMEVSRNPGLGGPRAKAEPKAGETRDRAAPEAGRKTRRDQDEPKKFDSAPAGRPSPPSGMETLLGRAFGMVENPADEGYGGRPRREQETRRTPRRSDQWLVKRLIRQHAEAEGSHPNYTYSHARDGEVQYDLPHFAPGMTDAGRTAASTGTEMICLSDGRQSHFVAETLLRNAAAKESITIFAFSFDHPYIAREIIEAVKRGVCVDLVMNLRDIEGDSTSKKGVETLREIMYSTTRVHAPGKFTLFSQTGLELKPVYERYDRTIGTSVIEGHNHAKIMWANPYLIVGSTNWSVSSEANVELDVVLDVRDEQTGTYIEQMLGRMKKGAKEVPVTGVGVVGTYRSRTRPGSWRT